jgi:hypothetical protein
VIAEGVERPSQLAFLREQGCAAYQGYLACPPLPAPEFERWLANQRGETLLTPPAVGKPAPRKPAPRKAAARKPAPKKKPGATRK